MVISQLVGFLTQSRSHPERFAQPATLVLDNGTKVVVHCAGVIEFVPEAYQIGVGKHVLYSCGVHGNETAPIEICDELVELILAQSLKVTCRLMVQFANLPAMDLAERFVKENLNRLFCGAHGITSDTVIAPYTSHETHDENMRAASLERYTRDFFADVQDTQLAFHYDLHTAIRSAKYPRFAVYPFLHGKAYSRSQLEWLARAGIQAVLLSETPTTTYSYYSSLTCGTHSFTVELGKVQPFGHNNMADFAAARTELFSLVTEQSQRPVATVLPILFRISQVINRSHHDFRLHFADSAPNFTAFEQGQLFASEYDETGECVNTFPALQDHEAIVFPNARVALGQRALLTVVPISADAVLSTGH